MTATGAVGTIQADVELIRQRGELVTTRGGRLRRVDLGKRRRNSATARGRPVAHLGSVPAPQPVESSTGSNNFRVKDCKRNQFVLLPASVQPLIASYVAECAAKCAPK